MSDSLKEPKVEEAEKSFNDEELADIMNEIESLEEEFSSDSENKSSTGTSLSATVDNVAQVVTDAGSSQDSSESTKDAFFDDESLDQITAELEDIGVSPTMPGPAVAAEQAKVVSMNEYASAKGMGIGAASRLDDISETSPMVSSSTAPCTMEFTASGNMALRLKFNVSGQVIHLTLDEEAGMCIELGGGAKFTLPLSTLSKGRKAS